MRHWTTSFQLFKKPSYALPYESLQGFSVNRFVITIEFSINLTISTNLIFLIPDETHRWARAFRSVGCSMRDVHNLARHLSLALTQRYVETNNEV
jgi:hypothetical protein